MFLTYTSDSVLIKFHLGFLTYATNDALPSPILTKRYFAHPQYVTKELKESPQRLGIGQTTSGGNEGMAVLEGFVAVLEVRIRPSKGSWKYLIVLDVRLFSKFQDRERHSPRHAFFTPSSHILWRAR